MPCRPRLPNGCYKAPVAPKRQSSPGRPHTSARSRRWKDWPVRSAPPPTPISRCCSSSAASCGRRWGKALLAVHPIIDELVDDSRLGEGCHIAEGVVLVGGDLAQNAPHDLAGAGLGHSGAPLQQVGGANRADLLPHPGHELTFQLVARLLLDPQCDISVNALPLEVVWKADDGSFGYFRVGDEGTLDLGGAQPMTGDVDHVIDPAGQPVEPILIATSTISGEVEPGKVRKIGRHKTGMVAEHRAHLSGPGTGEAEIAFTWPFNPLAVIVDDDRLDPQEGSRRGSRLERRGSRDRRDQDPAGLGLPPGIDNRAALFADMIVIP